MTDDYSPPLKKGGVAAEPEEEGGSTGKGGVGGVHVTVEAPASSIICDDLGQVVVQERPDQCYKCCNCCGGRCGVISFIMCVVLFLIAVTLLVGPICLMLELLSLVPALIIIGLVHCFTRVRCCGRRDLVPLDFGCRIAVISFGALVGYQFGFFAAWELGVHTGESMTALVLLTVGCMVAFVIACFSNWWQSQYSLADSNITRGVAPGYTLPIYVGLGRWHFSTLSTQWTSVFITVIILLGLVSAYFLAAAQNLVDPSTRYNTANMVEFSAMEAYLSVALPKELLMYLIICTARSLRTHKVWDDEVLVLVMWGSVMVGALFENILYVYSMAHAELMIALEAVGVRAAFAAPAHACFGLITTLGVMQAYTVRRSRGRAGLLLLAHFLLAWLLHGTYEFGYLMSFYVNDWYVTLSIVIAVLINPFMVWVLYGKWKRDMRTHQPEALLECESSVPNETEITTQV